MVGVDMQELATVAMTTLSVEEVQVGEIVPDEFSLVVSNQTVFVLSDSGTVLKWVMIYHELILSLMGK